MSGRPVIPADTLADQARASDPSSSAWVSANAGSGKTHVLAQRVIRLLLDGVEPSKILCLTYTKAAAANMSNRVFRDLARWTTLDETLLSEEIERIDGRALPARLRRARQLFARALETPGGLKIQTIHAFCEAILHQFPLEANIAGHFEMLDAQMEQALVAEARRDMLTGIAARQDEALAGAFERVLAIAGEAGLDRLLGEIVANRDRLRAFLDQLGGDMSLLHEEFGFATGWRPAAAAAEVWPDSYFDPSLARAIAARAARAAKATAAGFADDLLAAGAENDPLRRFDRLFAIFVTRDKDTRTLRSKTTKNIMAKGVGEHFPDLPFEFDRFAAVLIEAQDRIALHRMIEATAAALTVADVLIGRYERLKAARGFLDFNDLISRTVRLLSRADVGPWVQYKLDRGIDHVLVDEAQDTSPDQWQVVRKLAEEFFAGLGARDNVTRTVFAVGDEKQSIYSFQGADPESFSLSGAAFSEWVRNSGGRFERVRLQRSFRSTTDVLGAVDLVFAAETARKGLTHDQEPIEHPTIRELQPGHVEVWPLIEPQQVEEPDDWTEAIDHASAPAVLLAEQIATTIRDWIGNGECLEGKLVNGAPRRMTAGDVLVLVRKRDRFVHALSRALKNRAVNVAGADRLSLSGHIAVKDLIALGRVALQPHDDLSLAALLRSPVFGLSEEQLFELAWNRHDAPLGRVLRQRAEMDPHLAPVVECLDRWANEAAFKPVFEFYAAVLARDGVRSKMVARLGPSAGEILDEFLSFALAVERTGLPGLESFLASLESAAPDIKREMDQTRDEVRIMTVHAAKGLEAPVVFLVDGAGRPSLDAHLPRLIPIEAKNRGWRGDGYLWRAGSDMTNSVSVAQNRKLSEKAEDEYRRLLYVGMTRAEDRLIVCGYRGKLKPVPGIWHDLVTNALSASPHSRTVPHPVTGAGILRFRRSPEAAVPAVSAASLPPSAGPVFAPLAPLPEQHAPVRSLSPSAAAALLDPPDQAVAPARSPVLDPQDEPSFAIARGLAIHRLLQMLPSMPESERESAARRYLDNAEGDWTAADRDHAWASVRQVLWDPLFGPVFAAGSRAEVAVTGSIIFGGRDVVVSGTVDRLSLSAGRVLIVDYKTNRPPPKDVSGVPEAYIVQLSLYRALLAKIYPGREITAALLYTEAPRLIELPAALMDAALERLTRA
ncbi:MAG: double-strand break repair helicase AddA [Mesorhizobium sp.]|nr:double-strand break repair helicase AddA [Mesorhizobium sp.]MCO5161435.1 double-strand break repair helicase AddA [Mesorhizobium sp.]